MAANPTPDAIVTRHVHVGVSVPGLVRVEDTWPSTCEPLPEYCSYCREGRCVQMVHRTCCAAHDVVVHHDPRSSEKFS